MELSNVNISRILAYFFMGILCTSILPVSSRQTSPFYAEAMDYEHEYEGSDGRTDFNDRKASHPREHLRRYRAAYEGPKHRQGYYYDYEDDGIVDEAEASMSMGYSSYSQDNYPFDFGAEDY